MMTIRDVIDWIRPPEPPEEITPEAMAKHRNAVNRYRWNVTLSIIALMTFCAWALTDWGFARAEPVRRLRVEAQATDTKLNTILQLQLSERIRNLSYERCMVIGQEAKARKSSEIETWQVQYRQISGERYPEPSCT